MRKALAILLLATGLALAGGYPTMGGVIRLDPRLDQLLAPEAKVEVIASGFTWCEGPVWDRHDHSLLFSDAPHNHALRWKEGKGVEVYLEPSGYTGILPYSAEPGSNGLALDARGRLISCEHGDRRVSILEDGKRTLADNYQGKRFNSPNDLILSKKGDIYFTDPPYGLPQQAKDPRRQLPYSGVFRIGTDGRVDLLTSELTYPNGIAFSPDEKTLYVSQSDPARAIWMAYPVGPDGLLGPGRVLRDVTDLVGEKMPGLPDGFEVDQHGNLWASGPGGLWIMAPDGTPLGRIDTGHIISNCAWGDDGSTLYITDDDYLVRIRTLTRGLGW